MVTAAHVTALTELSQLSLARLGGSVQGRQLGNLWKRCAVVPQRINGSVVVLYDEELREELGISGSH